MKAREFSLGLAVCAVMAALLFGLKAFDKLDVDAVLAGLLSVSVGALSALALFLHRTRAWLNARQIDDRRPASHAIATLEGRIQALSHSEQRFRDLVEAASDRFWEMDERYRFRYVSDPAGAAVEPAADAVIGRNLWDLVGGNPRKDALWALFKADLDARRPLEDFHYQHMAEDGTKRHWSISGRPIFGLDGSFQGYRGWSKDISVTVEQQIALRTSAKEAEIANSAKSEFLANMSHELRTPLNAIIGFSQIIKDSTLGPDNTKYRDYAVDIHESGQHLLALINDILDISKIESGKDELHEDLLDIAEVIEASSRLVQARAVGNKVALVFELQGNTPQFIGDARKIKQILVNLLSNAVKFSDPGSMVTVTSRCDAEQGLTLRIRDNGIGMTAEEIPLALSIFGQVDAGPDRNCDGTGLGLPLAKALAEQHGGSLELESEPGKGTTATVRLPASRLSTTDARIEQATAKIVG